ncbi:hypothetical protein GQ457_02G025540 [Hibiscus cannabinus]
MSQAFIRMMLFIKSNDYQVWDVVEDGPFIPIKREGDRMIPKVKVEMTNEERRKMQVNDKALHMLFCALGPNMYSKISSNTSAKEVWDTLETTYEGTNMEPDENVTNMFDQFSIIRTMIIEAKDLKTLKLDALMGSLLTHEIMKQGREEEEKREEKKLKKKEVEKKKIGIALKASQEESDFSGEEDDEEMTMLAKRFTSDEESSDEEEQEVANLCLMAHEEDSKVTSNSSKYDLTYDELFEEYEELQEICDELSKKYKESILKHKEIILDLKIDRDSLYEAHYDLGLKMRIVFVYAQRPIMR